MAPPFHPVPGAVRHPWLCPARLAELHSLPGERPLFYTARSFQSGSGWKEAPSSVPELGSKAAGSSGVGNNPLCFLPDTVGYS